MYKHISCIICLQIRAPCCKLCYIDYMKEWKSEKNSLIYSWSVTVYPLQGCGGLESIPADIGRWQGTPWTSQRLITELTYRDKQPFMLTFTPMGNLESHLHVFGLERTWYPGIEPRIFLLWGNSANHWSTMQCLNKSFTEQPTHVATVVVSWAIGCVANPDTWPQQHVASLSAGVRQRLGAASVGQKACETFPLW